MGARADAPIPISDNPGLNGDANGIIQMPVETAIHRFDPVIFLLAGLGASLDIGIKQSYEYSWSRKASLLEAVEETIKNVDMELKSLKEPSESEAMEVDNANQPEWKAWVVKSSKAAKDFEKEVNARQRDKKRITERTRMKDYLEEVLGLLKEKKAKTWKQLHPDSEQEEEITNGTPKQEKQAIPFEVWSSDWRSEPIMREKVSLYEELYEACWNGDDEKIRELCLPPLEGATRKVAPIQIVCKTTEGEPCLNLMVVLFGTDTTVCRVHSAARCDPSSSLVDGGHCPNDRCRSAKDKARSYHHSGFHYVGH